MDKIKQLIESYVGVCEFIFKIIPKTESLSPELSFIAKTVLTWIVIPILVIAFLGFLWKTVKLLFITGLILLFILPTIYIILTKKKDE